MKRRTAILLAATAAAWMMDLARAEPPRFANGAPVPGEVARVTEEGLELTSPRGPLTVPWTQLSLGTRYRHQPGFRDALPKTLAGEAVTITPPVAPAPGPAPAAPGSGGTFTPVAPTPAPTRPPARPAPAAQPEIFPAGTFQNIGRSAVYAIAFSDEPADTVYLGVNTPEVRGPRPDELVVWWPHRTPQVAPEWVKQDRSAAGVFPVIKWAGKRQGNDVEVELTPILRMPSNRIQMQGLVNVNVRSGGSRTRYLLRHTEIKYAAGNRPLLTTPLFDAPAVKTRFTEGGRRMIAQVKVGDWDILPLQGLDGILHVEVVDDRGRSVERARVKTDEATVKAKSEAWEQELKRMKGGETYTVKGQINLGPVFGEAKFEASVAAVDLKF